MCVRERFDESWKFNYHRIVFGCWWVQCNSTTKYRFQKQSAFVGWGLFGFVAWVKVPDKKVLIQTSGHQKHRTRDTKYLNLWSCEKIWKSTANTSSSLLFNLEICVSSVRGNVPFCEIFTADITTRICKTFFVEDFNE